MNNFQPDARMRCACGYDLLRTPGNDNDIAWCLTCGWKAAGEWAEHSGYHHFIDTRHSWALGAS